MKNLSVSGSGLARSSLLLGEMRARALATLADAHRDRIGTLDDLRAVARAAGWRDQAIQHAIDVLTDGVDGQRLVVTEHEHVRLVRDREAS